MNKQQNNFFFCHKEKKYQKTKNKKNHSLGEDNCNPWTKKGPSSHDVEHIYTSQSEN